MDGKKIGNSYPDGNGVLIWDGKFEDPSAALVGEEEFDEPYGELKVPSLGWNGVAVGWFLSGVKYRLVSLFVSAVQFARNINRIEMSNLLFLDILLRRKFVEVCDAITLPIVQQNKTARLKPDKIGDTLQCL